MILKSEIKLGTPFRRIIFAMCVVDLLQSGCCIISTLSSPKDTPGIWGAYGNDLSCSITGFIFQVSSTAASLYMVSLMLHYLIFVNRNITEKYFRTRIEPWLHTVPILFSLVNASILWALDNLNQADVVCWIAPVPYNCINEPDIECIRGKHSYEWRWVLAATPNALALVAIIILGWKINKVVRRREKEDEEEEFNQQEQDDQEDDVIEEEAGSSRLSSPLRPPAPAVNGAETPTTNIQGIETSHLFPADRLQDQQTMEDRDHMVMKIDLSTGALVKINENLLVQQQARIATQRPRKLQEHEEGQGNQSPLVSNQFPHFAEGGGNEDNDDNKKGKKVNHGRAIKRRNKRSRGVLESSGDMGRKKKDKILGFRYIEVRIQAGLFTGSFLTCYTWVYLNGTYEAIPGKEAPYEIRILLWTFFPLQGFLNIFVFIRPHVIALMKKESGVSMFAAAWKVIKSGADVVSKEAVNRRNFVRQALLQRSNVRRNDASTRHGVLLSDKEEQDEIDHRRRQEMDNERRDSSSITVSERRPVAEVVHDENASRMEELSSIGDFVSSKGDVLDQEEDDIMYGDNDYDIYDDDGGMLSYADEELLHFYDDLDNDDKISFGPDYEDEEQGGL